MLKKIMIGLLLVSSLFSQTDWKNKFWSRPKSIMSLGLLKVLEVFNSIC